MIGAPARSAETPRSEVAARLRDALKSAPAGVLAAYLFGSEARGEAGPRSDVDVAVLFAEPPAPALANAASRLEGELEALLRRPVQVIALNRAPADLVHRVLRDGEILLDRDRSARLRFEVRARNEYFDLEPIRREYRRTPS